MIPHRMLSPEALRGVIEAFITREGTDYGMHEVPLATKVAQVRYQLDVGTAVIVYDEATDSCTIQPTEVEPVTAPVAFGRGMAHHTRDSAATPHSVSPAPRHPLV
jgi:uncharacterized protein YheU (UPF0270 family)